MTRGGDVFDMENYSPFCTWALSASLPSAWPPAQKLIIPQSISSEYMALRSLKIKSPVAIVSSNKSSC